MSFEERKAVLKWYFKFENISEVQRQWRNQFGTQPPTRLTIVHIRDKFEIDGTVGQNSRTSLISILICINTVVTIIE